MTSVEKRRSGRKSGVHRKHSDGGYSDTSSGGSFLDETDREVSSLTDRAFRSLCIGDEAVYNDADLCSSSPCTHRDRQLAFSQSGLGREKEDREELKRAAHESFSFRVQQYGQDWIHGGMYGAEIPRDPEWEVYGQKTQGRVSATFQHSFVETSQQEKSLREEHLSFLSNGATELSLQQRRSHSRVSSLIKAFNSEGQGTGLDGKLREWDDEKCWDKSTLMSIQKELSELSYQQNFNNGFSSADPFSPQDTNVYSSEVVAHMNSASSFVRSSHSKHSMSAQVNCNSNFFIHSEFSPFKVWRDHNRFPFQQGEVSGFVHCSEFPKWYETPMYKELSLETQPQAPYRFDERGIRHHNNLMSVVHPPHPRSTSTSTMLQKASAVEKRCESELASHYPYRKRTQSLGTNRLPSQRPLTASPTTEISQRVRDTISSVEALRQKIKMMTEQNMAAGIISNQQAGICVAPNVVNSKSSTTPFNISQLLTPAVHVHQEAEISHVPQYTASPQPVEHPPVRAESRGTSLDFRMSSYKSRATSLLFNLKDNRKRVKSTYSPTKFKGLEPLERNKQPSYEEPRDTVIDIPDFPDSDNQYAQTEECSGINAASHQYVNHYYSTGLPLATPDSKPATAHSGQKLSDYHAAQIQGEMVHHSGFTGFIPQNYNSNSQNPDEGLTSFTPYKQGMIDNVDALGLDVHKPKSSLRDTEMQRLNADSNQIREYLISEAHTEQSFNKTVGREFPNVNRYQQLKDHNHDYSNVSTQDRWRQTNSQDTEKLNLKADSSPWKQDKLKEKDQYSPAYQRAAVINKELNSSRDRCSRENKSSINKEVERTELGESYCVGASSPKMAGLVNSNMSIQLPEYAPFSNETVGNQALNDQLGAFMDKYPLQTYYGHNKENKTKDNNTTDYNTYTSKEYRNQHNLYSQDEAMFMQETDQRKQYTLTQKENEMQSLWSMEPKPHFQKKSVSPPENASVSMVNQVKDREFAEVKAEQATAENRITKHTQAELAKAQPWAQEEQPRMESARSISAKQTSSEKTKAELREDNRIEQAKTEHMKGDNRTGEQTEKPREKQLEQYRVKKVKEVAEAVLKKAEAMHMTKEEGEQVKPQQVGAGRLKEHKKTEPLKSEQTEQARTQKAEQTVREKFKAEHVEEEKAKESREAERMKTKTEKFKTEQADTEHKKAEHAKQGQIIDQQAEQKKATVVEMKTLKANHIKVEDDREVKGEEDSVEPGQMKREQSTKQRSKDKEEKVEKEKREQAKLEQIKVELANAELIKIKTVHEISSKSAAKPTGTQVKSELDKVEQVKTELAKAKAELAKIKEKMRGEQKEKARNVIIKVDSTANRGALLGVNNNKSEDQQKEESFVSRNRNDQADRGADEYDRLRQKYGFTNASSTNTNKVSNAGSHSSQNSSETPTESLHKLETVNIEKSKEGHSPTCRFSTTNIENKEMAESQYVYSESSKEFKLTGNNKLPATSVDTVNNDGFQILKKCDPVNQTDVALQRKSDLAKLSPLQRKPKSTEHSTGPAKESPFTPLKALSHKERAQTKQEILTSKIKAHAEKEISAIKEKGFAMRDGFISKSSPKQLLHDVSKKHGSTMSSKITPKHQMETLGIQMVPVKSVSPLSSAITPVKSATATNQQVDPSQKQVQLEKSFDNVLEPHTEEKQMGSYMRADKGLVENQRKEKHKANHEEHFDKQGEDFIDRSAVNTDHLNKKKEDTLQDTALVEPENSNTVKTQKSDSNHEAVFEDSAPSLMLISDQNKSPVADENLQIMGIMVTVREKKPSLNRDDDSNSTQELNHSKDKECRSSALDKSDLSSSLEVLKGNTPSVEVNMTKAKDIVVEEIQPILKEDQTNSVMNNHSENVQETSTLQITKNLVSENIMEKETNTQLENSSTNAKPNIEIQVQNPLTPLTVTLPVKTQPLIHKQDAMRENVNLLNKATKETTRNNDARNNTEIKNPDKNKPPAPDENLMGNVMNTTINNKNDSKRDDSETVINHDAQLSLKDNLTTVNKTIQGRIKDSKPLAQLEEHRHDSPAAKLFNETSPFNHLTGNENKHVSPKLQCKETDMENNNHVDDNVHIDSIAIRVLPAVTGMDNKNNISNNDFRTEDLTAASTIKTMQDSLEDKSGVQYVLSSVRKLSDSLKASNQQKSISNVNIHAKDGTPQNVKKSEKAENESKTQTKEEDYFQVHRLKEINEAYNSVNAGQTSQGVSNINKLPGLQPNTEPNSYIGGKGEVDQSKRKTVESSSVNTQEIKSKNLETQEKLAQIQSDGPTEGQSNSEQLEAGQAHVRQEYTESQSSSATKERQQSENIYTKKENAVKEKPNLKPKERVSAIPEISAIADYARLKVIVSEDRTNTIQEFSPNKKEGFFPLIQTRHSSRPVFTADPKGLSAKEKRLPNKTEVSAKENKEPKALVFPITEKEHQRTGMFKLGDKERQDKPLIDITSNEKHVQHLKERNKSLIVQTEQVAGASTQRVSQIEQSIHQPNNKPLQTTSSSAVNTQNTISEGFAYFEKNSYSQHTSEQLHTMEECITLRKELIEKQKDNESDTKTESRRTNELKQERLATHHAGKRTNLDSRDKQSEEKQNFRREEQIETENIRIKHMIEESRASLAEEERRSAQREEERRAREREAIAIKIKERREKQREAVRKAEEDRKPKQAVEERIVQKEAELKARQLEEERTIKEAVGLVKIEEERKRAKLKEEEMQIKDNEIRGMLTCQEEERAAQEKHQKRPALEKDEERPAIDNPQSRDVQKEHQRRGAQVEPKRRPIQERQQTRPTLEEQHRRTSQDDYQRRCVQEEHQKTTVQEKQQRKATFEEQQNQEEKQRNTAQETQPRKAAQEQQQRRAVQEEQQRRAVQEEHQRRAALEEQQRKAVEEEHQMRMAQEKQQRRAAQEEQQRKAVQEEHQKRAAVEEKQRKAAEEEHQMRMAQEKQQTRAALEEQQRKAVQEEHQRRAAVEEKQRKAAEEEHQRKMTQEKQQRRAALEEEQRRGDQKEQQRKVVEEEHKRRTAQEKQQKGAALEEQQKMATQETHQRINTQEELRSKTVRGEQQMSIAQEEHQKTTAHKEHQKGTAQEEYQKSIPQEEQQSRPALIEEQRQAKYAEEKILANIKETNKGKETGVHFSREEQIKQTQKPNRAELQTKEHMKEREEKEWMRAQRKEGEEMRIGKEKIIIQQKEKNQAKEEKTRLFKEDLTALKNEDKRVAQEQMLAQSEDEIRAKKREGTIASHKEMETGPEMEEQKRAGHRMDALQYYAITSTESERKPRERQECSPLSFLQKNYPSGFELAEDSGFHTKPYRPNAPSSPAPSLPRSNTSSPALGTKPLMFRVKDNTIRSSSLTKSIKPRFHKNFGEEFRVGSPMERGFERGEEGQEIMRRSAVTPVSADTGSNRLATIKESLAYQPESLSLYSAPLPKHRPYSRRSIALDEEDSRSVISNMSEDVESFATSATDLADVRGLNDFERPESACSFSSDLSRSLGKPPAVPPKSEKALQKAKRLTSRRIKKELSKPATDHPGGVEKVSQDVSNNLSSSSTEVHFFNRHSVASPHFSPPVSIAHAPTLGCILPSSNSEQQSSHLSAHASPHATPHATGPISLPVALPHAAAPVSLPVASPHATVLASHTAAHQTVAHVSSSSTLHHTHPSTPLTQYHVESNYPHYPLTQRKVLQDLGSGQYYVVDVPVQVKTKTFFDPETGKYVQLNVRESAQSTSQPQQTYSQPKPETQMQVKPQHQPLSQASPTGKTLVFYQGYHGYHQGYQPVHSMPPNRSSATVTLHQDQQPAMENQGYGCPDPEIRQNSEEHCYSPEKTPYMDTVTGTEKTHNTVYNTHGSYESFPECDTNSQLARSSVCENDNSAHSQYQPRNIITMSELDDFMEVSDW